MSKSVKEMAWRSASSTTGASTIWTEGLAAAEPVFVVVLPSASTEREKMTWPAGTEGWLGCGLAGVACCAGGVAGVDCDTHEGTARSAAIAVNASARAGKNIMNQGLSAS